MFSALETGSAKAAPYARAESRMTCNSPLLLICVAPSNFFRVCKELGVRWVTQSGPLSASPRPQTLREDTPAYSTWASLCILS